MSALSLVPDLAPETAEIHHPSCPTRVGQVPCVCPTSTEPLDHEPCPQCTQPLQLWKAFAVGGWAEWLVCGGCLWRELL